MSSGTISSGFRAGFAMLAILATACIDGTAPRPGKLSLLLTDAPGDVKTAVVTIDRIYLQPSEDSDDGRIILRDEDVTVDLLTLANETADLISEVTVPGGSYSQLRFVISGGYIEVENADGSTSIFASSPNYAGLPAGETADGALKMPSLAQSGLKVKLPGDAVDFDGDTRILLVDFDVAQSFGKEAGASGMWVMHPVIEATELNASGGLNVTVTKAASVTMPTGVAISDFKAVLTSSAGSAEELALTDANADGTFEAAFDFAAPGTYTLDLKAPTGVTFTTDVTRPATVTIGSAQTPAQAFVLTAVTK